MKLCGSEIVDEFNGFDAFVWFNHFLPLFMCVEMLTASLRASL
jgi:hypothetical protein